MLFITKIYCVPTRITGDTPDTLILSWPRKFPERFRWWAGPARLIRVPKFQMDGEKNEHISCWNKKRKTKDTTRQGTTTFHCLPPLGPSPKIHVDMSSNHHPKKRPAVEDTASAGEEVTAAADHPGSSPASAPIPQPKSNTALLVPIMHRAVLTSTYCARWPPLPMSVTT